MTNLQIKIQPSANQGYFVLIDCEQLGYYTNVIEIAKDVANYIKICGIEEHEIKCFNLIVKEMVTCLLKKEVAKSKR